MYMTQTIHRFLHIPISKIAVALLLVFAACLPTQAQESDIAITPNPVDTLFEVDLNNSDLLLKSLAQVTNNSDEILELQWSRTIVDMPVEWVTQVCDINLCWDAIVNSNVDMELGTNDPIILAPGESSNLDVYIQPKGVAGTGQVTLTISSTAEPDSVLAVGTYDLEVQGITTHTSNFRQKEIRLFPNPASDYLRISEDAEVASIVIYSLVGREVKTFDTKYNMQFDISDLPDGLYLARLNDRFGKVVKTVRLIKRLPRP